MPISRFNARDRSGADESKSMLRGRNLRSCRSAEPQVMAVLGHLPFIS